MPDRFERRAVIVGRRGQDAQLLIEALVGQRYGLLAFGRTDYWTNLDIKLTDVPRLDDAGALALVLREVQPTEIYYLAAHHQSAQGHDAGLSVSEYSLYHKTHVWGLINVLECIRQYLPHTRLFYACSSLIFGASAGDRQNETTALNPQGIYGITKAEGLLLCREYRRVHGIFASVGILYNHESHLRAEGFVSRKIIEGAIQIARKKKSGIEIANLKAVVDWSYAPDFIEAFQAVLRAPRSDDFVISSGVGHSVEEFVAEAFSTLGLSWRDFVKTNPDLVGRTHVTRIGNPAKLTLATGWVPRHTFREMIAEIAVKLSQPE